MDNKELSKEELRGLAIKRYGSMLVHEGLEENDYKVPYENFKGFKGAMDKLKERGIVESYYINLLDDKLTMTFKTIGYNEKEIEFVK